jgi:hypothetical protein
LAISRIISSVKAFGFVDVPISTWGLTLFTTDSRSLSPSDHSSSLRAKGFCAGVNWSPKDFTSNPGLSKHLEKVQQVAKGHSLNFPQGLPDLLCRFVL